MSNGGGVPIGIVIVVRPWRCGDEDAVINGQWWRLGDGFLVTKSWDSWCGDEDMVIDSQ